MTPLPLTLFSRLGDYWHQLSPGARDNTIGGLLVFVVAGIAGLLLKFGKRILRAIQVRSKPIGENTQQEVKVQIELVPPTAVPPPVADKPLRTLKSPDIP